MLLHSNFDVTKNENQANGINSVLRNMISRREYLIQSGAAGLSLAAGSRLLADDSPNQKVTPEKLPPVRQLTRGPKHHWFGYYDKLQFDPSSRYVLGMQVDFEHRSPQRDDVIKIGMVDTAANESSDSDKWIELGESRAWGWQQGCMLQWLPGSTDEVIWNDRVGSDFVCHVLNVNTKARRTIGHPIYNISPDAKTAISTDFRRLNDVRPGYGYAGLPDPLAEQLRPTDSGIWKLDLARGKQELLLSISDVAKFGTQADDMRDAKHWFNHLLFNTDGSRFIFLHRWRPKGVKSSFRTRMLTASADGKDLYIVDPSGHTSHFIWRDERTIVAWTRPKNKDGFFVFTDKTDDLRQIGEGVMSVNGHNTYLAGNEWILNDTYPDKDRLQHPYLYHVKTGRRVPLGHFLSPKEYTGEWRCDNHPRSSPDGRMVCIDSPHGSAAQGGSASPAGQGRQMYLIDISGIVG